MEAANMGWWVAGGVGRCVVVGKLRRGRGAAAAAAAAPRARQHPCAPQHRRVRCPRIADPIDGAFGQATVFPETTTSKPWQVQKSKGKEGSRVVRVKEPGRAPDRPRTTEGKGAGAGETEDSRVSLLDWRVSKSINVKSAPPIRPWAGDNAVHNFLPLNFDE